MDEAISARLYAGPRRGPGRAQKGQGVYPLLGGRTAKLFICRRPIGGGTAKRALQLRLTIGNISFRPSTGGTKSCDSKAFTFFQSIPRLAFLSTPVGPQGPSGGSFANAPREGQYDIRFFISLNLPSMTLRFFSSEGQVLHHLVHPP